MNLRLACADFTFPLLPHGKVLDLIAMLDVEGVDVGLFEGRSHLQPSQVFPRVSESARRLRKALDERGLKPADIFLQTAPDFASLAPNQPDPKRRRKARELFLRALEFTVECGGKHLSALPGVYFPGESRAESFGRCCQELAWRCERAAKSGVVFAVEAHVGSVVPSPREALRLVRNVPGLTLTLDYTHFTRRGVPDSAIEPLVPFASHFHARGTRKGRLQAPLKQNTIDYARVLRAMKQYGYPGYIGFEYVWIDWEHCNEVDNLSETILLRDFFRSAWAKLSRP
jgi:sugar phosphate isomerase/epimerase